MAIMDMYDPAAMASLSYYLDGIPVPDYDQYPSGLQYYDFYLNGSASSEVVWYSLDPYLVAGEGREGNGAVVSGNRVIYEIGGTSEIMDSPWAGFNAMRPRNCYLKTGIKYTGDPYGNMYPLHNPHVQALAGTHNYTGIWDVNADWGMKEFANGSWPDDPFAYDAGASATVISSVMYFFRQNHGPTQTWASWYGLVRDDWVYESIYKFATDGPPPPEGGSWMIVFRLDPSAGTGTFGQPLPWELASAMGSMKGRYRTWGQRRTLDDQSLPDSPSATQPVTFGYTPWPEPMTIGQATPDDGSMDVMEGNNWQTYPISNTQSIAMPVQATSTAADAVITSADFTNSLLKSGVIIVRRMDTMIPWEGNYAVNFELFGDATGHGEFYMNTPIEKNVFYVSFPKIQIGWMSLAPPNTLTGGPDRTFTRFEGQG